MSALICKYKPTVALQYKCHLVRNGEVCYVNINPQ